MKDQPTGRRAKSRAALLDAAAKVFVARGYEAASLDEIAAEAGYTRGAIYSSFDDKEDLFLSVVTSIHEKWISSFDPAFREAERSGKAMSQSIEELWSAFVSSEEQQTLLMMEFRVVALRNPAVAQRLADFEKQMEQSMAAIVREHMDAGLLNSPLSAEDLAVLMYSAGQGIMLHQMACGVVHNDIFSNLLKVALNPAANPRTAPKGRRARRPSTSTRGRSGC